jgi:hypothetical protein
MAIYLGVLCVYCEEQLTTDDSVVELYGKTYAHESCDAEQASEDAEQQYALDVHPVECQCTRCQIGGYDDVFNPAY